MFTRFVARLVALSMVCALLLAPIGLQAEDAKIKPIFISSFAPVDELFADFDYMAGVFEAQDGAKMARQLVGPYLGGIDRKRPSGGYVLANGEGEPIVVLFVPVNSLKVELEILEGLIGKGEELADGVIKFVEPAGAGDEAAPGAKGAEAAKPTEFFVKEKNRWAFISTSPANLQNLPADPIALLDGLDKKYDIGQRILFENIDGQERQQLIDEIKKQIAESRALPAEEGVPELSPEWQAAIEQTILKYAAGMKSLDYGLTIDSKLRNVALSLSVEPIADSELAKTLASVQTLSSNHSGVLLSRAAVLVHRAAKFPKEDIGLWDQFAKQLIDDAPADGAAPIENEAMAKEGKELGEKIIKAMHADGDVEWGGSVVISDDGKVLMLAGAHFADVKGLEAAVREFWTKYQDDPSLKSAKIEWDFAKHGEVRIIKLTPPDSVPRNEKLVGADPATYYAIDGNFVYMASGNQCLKQLKDAIDRSAARPNFKVAPFRQRVDIEPIVRMAIKQTEIESPTVERLLRKLADAPGKTGININLLPSKAGLEGRLEIDEALLSTAPEVGELIWQAILKASEPMAEPLAAPRVE